MALGRCTAIALPSPRTALHETLDTLPRIYEQFLEETDLLQPEFKRGLG